MTTIYLIRHAEAEGNLYRIAQGQHESILTDRGWRQVRALERRFTDVQIDAVYSSDLYRTCATASAIYKPKGLPLHRVPALREICVGVWEHQTWGDIYLRWPEQMHYFGNNPAKWHVEGAEDPRDVLKRVLEAVRELAAKHAGQTIALFSHGYAIRLLLAHLQGYSIEEVGKSPTGDNTAVSCLEAEGEKMRVVFRDDNSHLKTPEFLAKERGGKRTIALEGGLYFRPLQLPEQEPLLRALTGEAWSVDEEAANRTLVAYLSGQLAGLVQLGTEPGWIARLHLREDLRGQRLGVQLIGQAVMYWRPRGMEKLFAALPEGHRAERFFREYGFAPNGRLADGRPVLEKEIGFRQEFLGKNPEY